MNIFINIKDFIYYNRKYFLIAIIVLFILLSFIFFGHNTNEEFVEPIEKEKVELPKEEKEVMIDIKGEIENPGIYEATEDNRVMDIINQAGGLKSDADTSDINLSMKVEDEMVIIVPKKDDEQKEEPSIKNDASINKNEIPPVSGKVSINSATKEELMTVKGIGEVKANKIIEYRNTNGKFKSLEELTNVSGIGTKTFEKIKEYLTL